MNQTDRQALAERIGQGSGLLDENHTLRIAYTVVVRNVLDQLDEEGRLCEPPKTVELSDLWTEEPPSRENVARLIQEVESWPSVIDLLSNPLGPETIKAIRKIRKIVRDSGELHPPLRLCKLVVEQICIRHGWSQSS